MKKYVIALSFLSALSFPVVSQAAPVTYQFSASGSGIGGSNNIELLNILGAATYLNSPGATGGVGVFSNLGINGTFVYDNAFNIPSVPSFSFPFPSPAYGSQYVNAASNFVGSAFGINFATADGQVLVYNDAPWFPASLKRDLVTADASDISHFTIGGYSLDSVGIYWSAIFESPTLVSSTDLPLSPLDLVNPGIQLVFSKDGNKFFVNYTGVEISQVPVPAALPLMFSAIAGLFGLNRLRKK